MSIYSGFAIRKMQEKYNKLVGRLISLLQSDLIEFMLLKTKITYQNQDFQQYLKHKFAKYVAVLSKLQVSEQHKYLQPKFSHFCAPLKNFIAHIVPSEFILQAIERKEPSLMSRKSRKISRSVNEKQQKIFHQSFQQKFQRLKTKSNSKQSQEMKSKLTQFLQINENKEQNLDNNQIPISIFTIQEVEEIAETKQFKINNIQQISLQIETGNFSKRKIYKSHDKLKLLQTDQKDIQRNKDTFHNRSKSEIKQHQYDNFKTQRVQTKHKQFQISQSGGSEAEKRFYQTDINFKPTNKNFQFKKIKILNKSKFKSSMSTPKSQRYIHLNYKKKYLDRSELKQLVVS